MQTILVSVSHQDETNKYWSDSYIKNKTIAVNDGETIHEAIARVLEAEDGCTMAYKGKPQGNVYVDKKDGTGSRIVGYHYRTKHYIENRSDNIQKGNVPFTTWVTIHGEVNPVELDDVEA